MAHGHGLMSSPNFQYFSLHCSDMKAIKLLNDQDVLVYDRTRIKWNRDLGSLRNFVENILGFTGVWKSTGGKSKQFTNSNSNVIITWYPGKLNSLTFNGKNGEAVKKALVAIIDNDCAMNANSSSDSSCYTITDTSVDTETLSDFMRTGLNLSETMNEVAKSSTVNDGVLASDCSTLEELENFIDRSFKNMGKLPPKAIDGSTPSRKLYDSKSDTLAERFETFKMEIESGVLLLKAELSEQTQIINACKQDICKLTNENLILKSRLRELEEKVFDNNSIPCCKGNAQTAASNDDNSQSATVTVSDSSTVTIRQSSNNSTLSVNEQPIKHRENNQDNFDLQSQISRVNQRKKHSSTGCDRLLTKPKDGQLSGRPTNQYVVDQVFAVDSLVTMKRTTNNPPPSNNSSSCESDNSVAEFLPTINALKEGQGINYKNKESRQSVKPSDCSNRNKCKKPTQNTNIKSPFVYHRTRHRQSPNLVDWQNHLQLVYSRTRSSAPMNHQLIPKSYPRPLMDIQCYPVKPLPMKPRRKDQLNWFRFYY